MHLLRPVFADPAITKVFHGADNDCVWLQRDFHIYVVNLFDTARRSLAHLLRTFCGVITNKDYQKADWRMRPLTPPMLEYARADAHYLLFLAARLRWELLHPPPLLSTTPHSHAAALPRPAAPPLLPKHPELPAAAAAADAAVAAVPSAHTPPVASGAAPALTAEVADDDDISNDIDSSSSLGEVPPASQLSDGAGTHMTGEGGEEEDEEEEEAREDEEEEEKEETLAPPTACAASSDPTAVGRTQAPRAPEEASGSENEDFSTPALRQLTARGSTKRQPAPGTAQGRVGAGAGGGRGGEELYRQAVQRSNAVCLQLFEKDGGPESAAMSLVSRCLSALYSNKSMDSGRLRAAVRALCLWRDSLDPGFPCHLSVVGGQHSSLPLLLRQAPALHASAAALQPPAVSHHVPEPPLAPRPAPYVQFAARPTNAALLALHCLPACLPRACSLVHLQARAEDESLRYVLSDAALLSLAVSPPPSVEALLACVAEADKPAVTAPPQRAPSPAPSGPPPHPAISSPLPSPSPLVVRHAEELYSILAHAHGGGGTAAAADSLSSGLRQQQQQRQVAGGEGPEGGSGGAGAAAAAATAAAAEGAAVSARANGEDWESILRDAEAGDSGGGGGGGGEREKVPRSWLRQDPRRAREQFIQKFSCRAPVYDNCRIYGGDDRLLCFCDKKKLEWYVQRGLAEYVSREPPLSVRLLFEPRGRPEDDANDFYVQSKSNACVACGEAGHYLRYRLVPSCYRHHFPEHLKSHRSHDIVLLCVDCHEVAHKAAERHKRQVAAQLGVPLVPAMVHSGVGDDELLAGGGGGEGASGGGGGAGRGVRPDKLRRAAMAVLKHGDVMPQHRLDELLAELRAYYGRHVVSRADVEAALAVGMGPKGQRRLRNRAHSHHVLAPTPQNAAKAARYSPSQPQSQEQPQEQGEQEQEQEQEEKLLSLEGAEAGAASSPQGQDVPPGAALEERESDEDRALGEAGASTGAGPEEDEEDEDGADAAGVATGAAEGAAAAVPSTRDTRASASVSASGSARSANVEGHGGPAGEEGAGKTGSSSTARTSGDSGAQEGAANGEVVAPGRSSEDEHEHPNPLQGDVGAQAAAGARTGAEAGARPGAQAEAGAEAGAGMGAGRSPSGSNGSASFSGADSERPSRRDAALGHGPHGKKVVEMLLREGGEEGLRAFIQAWRQVFVDALQPRFLPPGWAVLHSGKREFGEFSVYNSKRVASLLPEATPAGTKDDSGHSDTNAADDA
eukprot:jgi/Mesen1/3107/ME000184S02174